MHTYISHEYYFFCSLKSLVQPLARVSQQVSSSMPLSCVPETIITTINHIRHTVTVPYIHFRPHTVLEYMIIAIVEFSLQYSLCLLVPLCIAVHCRLLCPRWDSIPGLGHALPLFMRVPGLASRPKCTHHVCTYIAESSRSLRPTKKTAV